MPTQAKGDGEPRFSRPRSLFYSTLIVAAFFALVEAGLWWFDPAPPLRPRLLLRAIDIDIEFPFMKPDPELFWVPKPGFHGEFLGHEVRIDRLGLRGPDSAVSRTATRRRIVTFGDSITFGYGVGEDDTYAARLADGLGGRGVDVLNAGVTGYTSYQVLGRLRRLIGTLGADIASICVGWNDGTLRPVSDRVYAARLRATGTVEWSLGKWRLYRMLAGLYVRARLRAERAARVREQPRVPLDEYRQNLTEIVAECRRKGILPVFVRLPHRRVPGEPAPSTPYEAALLSVAADLDVATVSVGVLGLDGDVDDTREYFIDSLHLSPLGAEYMADRLAHRLDQLGVI